MTARLILRNQVYEVPVEIPLSQALSMVSIAPESVLAIRSGQLITEDTILYDGDLIRLEYVISGG